MLTDLQQFSDTASCTALHMCRMSGFPATYDDFFQAKIQKKASAKVSDIAKKEKSHKKDRKHKKEKKEKRHKSSKRRHSSTDSQYDP